MAIRKMESFGWFTGSESTWIPKRWSIANGGFSLSTPGRRTGSNAVLMGAGTETLGHTFASHQTWIVHCAIKFRAEDHYDILVRDAGTAQVSLGYWNTLQTIRVWQGNVGTLLGTGSVIVLPNVWHHLIFRAKIDNTAGEIEVRVDGQTILNLTSIDTQVTANATANQISFSNDYYHDIVICDGSGSSPYNGIIGDCAVYCTLPNAAGAVSGWTPSAGSNYQNVDDTTPDSDTTYNSTAAAAATDRYAIPTPTLTGSCRGVCVAALVRKDDAGARTARTKLYDGTTLQSGTTNGVPDSYAFIEDYWQVNPTSGTHWTSGELAAAEPGIELVS